MNCIIHNVHNCEEFRFERREEMGFLQYYEMVTSTERPSYNVDVKIKCKLVKWERHGREIERHETYKVPAIYAMNSVRGRVNVVTANPLVKLVHPTVPSVCREIHGKVHRFSRWTLRSTTVVGVILGSTKSSVGSRCENVSDE